jgi:2,3-bisphosphoglycerate-independent phosphoglycerate mutase
MDGRDLPPTSAYELMRAFEVEIRKLPNVTIASLGGRYFGMDRDTNWERTQKVYDILTKKSSVTHLTPSEYIQSQYVAGKTDEFMDVVSFSDDPSFIIRDGDAVIHMNYRVDRALQMTKAFVEPEKT